MRSIPFILMVACFFTGCAQNKSGAIKQDSVAHPLETVAIDTTLDLSLASRPYIPEHSSKIFTDDEKESLITQALDSLLKVYSAQKYFIISANDKTWYVDQNKDLRIMVRKRSNETIQEIAIHLFLKKQLVAIYNDTDVSGQDTQYNRERIAVSRCPDCGVRFDLASYDTAITVLNVDRVNELSQYYYSEYNEVLSFLAEASIQRTDKNIYFFEREEPNRDRYAVNSALYDKFIKHINP